MLLCLSKAIKSLKEHPFTAFERTSLFTKCPVGDSQGCCQNAWGAACAVSLLLWGEQKEYPLHFIEISFWYWARISNSWIDQNVVFRHLLTWNVILYNFYLLLTKSIIKCKLVVFVFPSLITNTYEIFLYWI